MSTSMKAPIDAVELLQRLPLGLVVWQNGALVWQNERADGGWGEAVAAEVSLPAWVEELSGDDVRARSVSLSGGLGVEVIPLTEGRVLLLESGDSRQYVEACSSAISHDLRAPLRTMTGFLGLLSRRYADTLDERGRRYIRSALEGSKHLELLIEGLVKFMRSERPPQRRTLDLPELMEGLAQRHAARLDELGASLSWGALPTVFADRGQLTGLLDALLQNALNNASPDRPLEVRVEGEDSSRGWTLRVHDNGVGIPERFQQQIFLPLKRVNVQDGKRSVGLGLALSRRVARAHGGDVTVQSAVGEGSVFTVTLLRGRL